MKGMNGYWDTSTLSEASQDLDYILLWRENNTFSHTSLRLSFRLNRATADKLPTYFLETVSEKYYVQRTYGKETMAKN